jgi:[acyl-carrier-protein] S-malonyltransferase
MGREAYDAVPEARAIFDHADSLLGFNLSKLCFEGPADELTQTMNAQPAILVTSLAYLVANLHSGAISRRPAFLAGHSLGEYSALVAAGALAFRDALALVRERGRLMDGAGRERPGTMAAIVGLTGDKVRQICDASGAEPCNFNARTQTVIGGAPEAVRAACDLARERGGKGLSMNVAGAFHTSLMEPASLQFARVLEDVPFKDPTIQVIGNVTATTMNDADQCISDLGQQMARPVLWHDSIEHMRQAGVRTFIELGPGRALTAMIKRDAPELELVSLDGVAATASAS